MDLLQVNLLEVQWRVLQTLSTLEMKLARLFPKFIENSKVPVVLSKISPIEINAITLGPFIFSRGEMSIQTRNHEAIHWEQYKETLILGFLFLYAVFYIFGLLKYRSGEMAYYNIPFEREAYDNDSDLGYIFQRKPWSWARQEEKY